MNIQNRTLAAHPTAKDAPEHDSSRSRLESWISSEAAQPVNADVEVLTATLARRAGIAAVVFYGSGLWGPAGADTLYDFYVLVERLRDWAPGRILAVAGRALPPNVYYLEVKTGGTTLRCKYAVMRRSQFEAAARGEHFTPQIWARFCQPCRLLQIRDEAVRASLIRALADAVVTFHRRTLPLVAGVSIRDFWVAGLGSTYGSEIRSEKAGRAARRVEAELATFTARTRLALPLCGAGAALTPEGNVTSDISARERRRFRRRLALKRPWHKAVNFARLIKAGFTFQGGLDYARWKIERHSGVAVRVTDFQRRHPVLTGLLSFWKIVRRGGLR
ncbi:MAG: hypothetical protein PHQ04_03240 [Opitutaceae bacterium]|nr:hypothetical protein [Opitutaceae bacterium]